MANTPFLLPHDSTWRVRMSDLGGRRSGRLYFVFWHDAVSLGRLRLFF